MAEDLLRESYRNGTEKTKKQHVNRLTHLFKKTGSTDPNVLLKYIESAYPNPFTKRTYLSSLASYHLTPDEMRNNCMAMQDILRHEGYKTHDKYKFDVGMPTLRQRVSDNYSEDDWQYLLCLLYLEWPLRDNIPCYVLDSRGPIVSGLKDGVFPGFNFMYQDTDGNVHVVICNTKTVPKYYPPKDKIMSDEFRRVFDKVPKRDGKIFPLDPTKRQSKVVSRIFKNLGVGGINHLRRLHRRVAVESKSYEEITRIAELSFHSQKTANVYNS